MQVTTVKGALICVGLIAAGVAVGTVVGVKLNEALNKSKVAPLAKS